MMLLARFGIADAPTQAEFLGAVEMLVGTILGGAVPAVWTWLAPRNAIKLMVPLLAVLLVAACDTVSVGGAELTPAERCVGYTGAIMRYERILAEDGALTKAQRAAYDFALAGKVATCTLSDPE
jgi:hypothetical protein